MIHRTRLIIVGGLLLAYIYWIEDIHKKKIETMDGHIYLKLSEIMRLNKELKQAPLTAIRYWSYIQENCKNKKFIQETGGYVQSFIRNNNK